MELLEQIKNAGIVGCGGAGFPTHVKLNCKGKVDTLIVNGAECEPLLRTDRWLMRHRASEIVTAAGLCGDAVGAGRVYIALKEHYTQAVEALSEAIRAQNSRVELFRLQNFYPAGDEQALVLEVTGRTVPPAGIPLDAGAVVSNAATMSAIYDAVQGEAFTQKYLTVTGEVANPTILRVPIGTPLMECVEAAGGTSLRDYRILCGGPMMGKLYTKEEAQQQVVTKTTSGVTVLPADIPLVEQREMPLRVILRRAKTSCIQCSRCTEMCPRHLSGHPLQPHMIMRKLAYAEDVSTILDDKDVRQAQICSQCGVCEVYACPMGLQPRQVNIYVKDELAKAGMRYARTGDSWQPMEAREWRKAPSRRMAVRLGVGKYYDYEIDTLLTPEVSRVRLPLKQHIGAPAVPEVKAGDTVTLGQRIASCPEGAMGTNLSASISGVVTAVDDAITIERGNV
nr:4Fe-4S dicluster domain-containing protein [uncultured Oscillibacter sp.]